MTRDEIIKMAREAGFMPTVLNHWPAELERFFQAAYVAGAAAEREACAGLVDAIARDHNPTTEQRLALQVVTDAIRAKGNTTNVTGENKC